MQNSSNCHPNSPYILTIFYQLHIKEKSSGSRKPELFLCPASGLRGSRHKPCHPKRQKYAFMAALSYACGLLAKPFRFSYVQLQGLEARDISHAIQKGKKRLYGCPVLCLSPLSKALPLFLLQCFFDHFFIIGYRKDTEDGIESRIEHHHDDHWCIELPSK
jgi:hypothetical protein